MDSTDTDTNNDIQYHTIPANESDENNTNPNDIQLAIVETEQITLENQNIKTQTDEAKQDDNGEVIQQDMKFSTETAAENSGNTEQPIEQEEKEISGATILSNNFSHNDNIPHNKIVLTEFAINYWFIITITLAASSIGLITYILSNLWWTIFVFGGAGLIISIVIEGFNWYKNKNVNGGKNVAIAVIADNQHKYSELEEQMIEWKENSDEDGIYVETHFDNSYVETIADGKKGKKKRKRNVKVTGSTRVYHKKESGCLLIEKRALYTFQEYKGYEIGGGLSSLTGFSITVIVQLIKMAVNSQDVNHAANIFILLFITIAFLCLGCIIEIELRKKNMLPPNKKLFLTATSVALHEIKSIDRHSTTNYQNVSSELDERGGVNLTMKKIAIKWFQCLLGIYKLIQWMFIAATINTPLVMLIVVFIIFGLLLDLSVNKSNSTVAPNSTLIISIFTWIVVGIGIFAIFYLSQSIIDGGKEYYRLSLHNRIKRPQQNRLWILILAATVLLMVTAIMITSLDASVYRRKPQEDDKIKGSVVLAEQMFCVADSGFVSADNSTTPAPTLNRRRMQTDDEDNDIFTLQTDDVEINEQFCVDGREYIIFFALLFTLIAWWILLYASYYWKQNDLAVFRADSKSNDKMKRIWKRYSVINIGLKTLKKSSYFVVLGTGGSRYRETVVNVELDPSEAIKLHEYLHSVVPWFKQGYDVNTSIVYNTRFN